MLRGTSSQDFISIPSLKRERCKAKFNDHFLMLLHLIVYILYLIQVEIYKIINHYHFVPSDPPFT